MSSFAGLRLSPALLSFDAVNKPGEFLEKLSAHLWATSQMDVFRSASERYMQNFRKVHPEPAPPVPRAAIVLIGQGVASNQYPLFRKLRREGTRFRQVEDGDGLKRVLELLQSRAGAHREPYAHWFIDGGATPIENNGIVAVSYIRLSAVRTALTATIRKAFESRMSPELLRTTLAQMTPQNLGMKLTGDEPFDRFNLSLFTEGSGTQIYSTTFVQWAAREALRRAKPVTLVARYAPRAREASMHDLLSGNSQEALDPAGSLVDADMGAWYTWIGLQRLPGGDRSNFLVWFEEHREAVAVGPSFARGKEDSSTVHLAGLLQRFAG
jgi:hypothetical protein